MTSTASHIPVIEKPGRKLGDLAMRLRQLVQEENRSRLEIGLLLLDAKSLLPHGQFMPWIDETLGWSHETARQYMRLAEWHLENPDNLEFLTRAGTSSTALCTLACGPAEARHEALRRVQSGVPITCELARQLVRGRGDGEPRPDRPSLPQGVQRLLDQGTLGQTRADEVAAALSDASERVQALVDRWGVTDPALITELDRICRSGRETFGEIETTGCVPLPPPFEEPVPLHAATVRDLRAHLDYAANEHRRAGAQASQERRFDRIEGEMNAAVTGGTPVIVARSLEDVARAPDNCLLLLPAGDLPRSTILVALDNHNYRLVTVVAARGDTPVPVDGEAVAARIAQYRVDDLSLDVVAHLLGVTPPADIVGAVVDEDGPWETWLLDKLLECGRHGLTGRHECRVYISAHQFERQVMDACSYYGGEDEVRDVMAKLGHTGVSGDPLGRVEQLRELVTYGEFHQLAVSLGGGVAHVQGRL